MPDERTYGFQKDDAEALIQGIANGDNWFPEIRPRGGKAGIGGEVMWFTILEVLCPTRDYVDETTLVVQWDRYTGACGKEPPDAQYDGTYYVYQECGEDLDGQVADDLVGTKGKATYFRASAEGSDPRWIIDLLCHLPECL